MSKCVLGQSLGAALLAVALMPAPAAAGQSRCELAREWVADHCGVGMARSAEGTNWRCSKARRWIADRCEGRSAKRSKARYVADYDRPAKRKYRARTVYAYDDRPRDCCNRAYRPTRVRGAVYYADGYYGDGWSPRKFWKDQERNLP
jgi:hypothetical protein